MKKNNKTYLLLLVVVGVWGVIGFKVLSAVNPDTKEYDQIASNEVFVPKQLSERDTFNILAKYRDPFLGTVAAPEKARKTSSKSIVKPITPEKSIQYAGVITDKGSKQKIFFVTIEGQQQMMSLNDTFQEVKLVSGTINNIKVRYDGRTKTIALNK